MDLPPSYEDALRSPAIITYPSLIQKPQMRRPPVNAIKLWETREEQRRYEEMAVLYSIIQATESLEAAFAKGLIIQSEYQKECEELVRLFNDTKKALIQQKWITSIDDFFQDYNIICPRARDRLMISGVPVDRDDRVVVAQTVQAFITAKDSLMLEQRAVDQIQPLISDLVTSLCRVLSLPTDFHGTIRVNYWLQILNQMKAHEEIGEDEARQLIFDLGSAYDAFIAHLNNTK